MTGNKPTSSPAPTLGMFKLPRIRIDCNECDRHGEYDRDRAIARHGADMTMYDFMRLVANCPRRDDQRHPCRLGCYDLAYMFRAEPMTDSYSD